MLFLYVNLAFEKLSIQQKYSTFILCHKSILNVALKNKRFYKNHKKTLT